MIQNGTVELVATRMRNRPKLRRRDPIGRTGWTERRAADAPGGRRTRRSSATSTSGSSRPSGRAVVRFEGSAKGDMFDRLTLRGTVDLATGGVTLTGDLAGLALSETSAAGSPPRSGRRSRPGAQRRRGRPRARPARYDPKARPAAVHYDVRGPAPRRGLGMPQAPVPDQRPVGDRRRPRRRADDPARRGLQRPTTVRAEGTIALGDPAASPFDLQVDLIDLELDQGSATGRRPSSPSSGTSSSRAGRVDAAVHLVPAAERAGGLRRRSTAATWRCVYRHFPYPLDHLRGGLDPGERQLTVDLQTLVGGKPAEPDRDDRRPGPRRRGQARHQGRAVPIDDALLDACRPTCARSSTSSSPAAR